VAVVPYTVLFEDQPKGVKLVKWVLANGDTGRPVSGFQYSDQTIQVYGTFGTGGKIEAQGSNDHQTAGATFIQLTDAGGTPIGILASGIKQIMEHTYLLRPACTAGDGTTSLTVLMCLSSTRG
jgi:hypothetical protein